MRFSLKRLVKAFALTGIALFVVLGLIPAEVQVVPLWELQVLNSNRMPVGEIEVEQMWIDYDLGIDWQKDIQKTDKQGKVVFAQKTVKTALLRTSVFVPMKRLLSVFAIHEGTGKYAGIRVKGFSQYLDYAEGGELKHELVLQISLK